MNISSLPTNSALVLGGGGSTGNAWLIGMVAGLATEGLEVFNADPTVGTSAGATAAAQLAGTEPQELYEAALQPIDAPRSQKAGDRSSGKVENDDLFLQFIH